MSAESDRSYAILGTGALGGFYGSLLARAGLDVHFLLRSDVDHVRRHGLRLESRLHGDGILQPVQAYSNAEALPRCDVAVVSLKTVYNDQLAAMIPPALKPDGLVLVLQNGLAVEAAAAAAAPGHLILGGGCFLCTNKVGPGHIRHLDYGKILIGEFRSDAQGEAVPISDRMRQVASDFERAGIEIELSDNLWQARWRKLMWNIPFNGLSVILNASTQELMGHDPSCRLAESVIRDVLGAARACGCTIEDAFVDWILEFTEKMTPYDSSMKLDFEAGRPMELEAIYGNAIRAAENAGYDPVLVRALYQQLGFLDSCRT